MTRIFPQFDRFLRLDRFGTKPGFEYHQLQRWRYRAPQNEPDLWQGVTVVQFDASSRTTPVVHRALPRKQADELVTILDAQGWQPTSHRNWVTEHTYHESILHCRPAPQTGALRARSADIPSGLLRDHNVLKDYRIIRGTLSHRGDLQEVEAADVDGVMLVHDPARSVSAIRLYQEGERFRPEWTLGRVVEEEKSGSLYRAVVVVNHTPRAGTLAALAEEEAAAGLGPQQWVLLECLTHRRETLDGADKNEGWGLLFARGYVREVAETGPGGRYSIVDITPAGTRALEAHLQQSQPEAAKTPSPAPSAEHFNRLLELGLSARVLVGSEEHEAWLPLLAAGYVLEVARGGSAKGIACLVRSKSGQGFVDSCGVLEV